MALSGRVNQNCRRDYHLAGRVFILPLWAKSAKRCEASFGHILRRK